MAIKEKNIVDQLKTQIAAATIAGGYYNNLNGTNQVTIWQDAPFQASTFPAVNIRDTDISAGEEEQGATYIFDLIMTVEIDLIANGQTQLRRLKADVEKAINSDLTLDGNCYKIEFVSDQKVVEQKEYKLLGSTLTIEVYYQRNAWGNVNDYVDENSTIYVDENGFTYNDKDV